ncbi:MAG: hypothetical protein J1E41_04210 [Ruminococcus sp.]|nr:hypothetical protein [Ruminococcus sp.]
MLWIALAVASLGFLFLLYACLVVGARADRQMKEIMKKMSQSQNKL